MDDQNIIELFFRRDEAAISATDKAYGPLCRRIAMNILSIREDAEECVNDTYHTAWNRIPPTRPQSLKAFLGRIARDLSISRWRRDHARKRYNGIETLLSELDECVPSAVDVERSVEAAELTERIAAWLGTLDAPDRALFLRRYWYGDAVNALARERGETENRTAQRLLRLRRRLRETLEAEGVYIG